MLVLRVWVLRGLVLGLHACGSSESEPDVGAGLDAVQGDGSVGEDAGDAGDAAAPDAGGGNDGGPPAELPRIDSHTGASTALAEDLVREAIAGLGFGAGSG